MASEKVEDNNDEEQYIQAFYRHVIRTKSGNYPPLKRSLDGTLTYPNASGISSNRGNKLLQKSGLVTRQKLNNSRPMNEDCVYYNGSEHCLLQRRKRMKFPGTTGDQKNGQQIVKEDSDEECDLSKLVDVRKVLTPIASLADITRHDAIKRSFDGKALRELAIQSIMMIEKEQNAVMRYSSLLEVFLGDHPEPLYESVLNLPVYDHHLKLPEEDAVDADEKDHFIHQGNEEVARNGANEEDPFFAIPNLGGHNALLRLLPNDNSPQALEDVETVRQLAQIALQRNEEFVRNLKRIKASLIKANRIRERILNWSREYSGVPENGVTVPNALRAVKRGLISATTNMSMGGGHEMEDEIEENYEAA